MPASRPQTGSSITEQAIKSATKQFDLSLVFKLSLPNWGLRRIENLTLVPSLTELDLSHNRISRMEGLDALESLKRLVLSKNEISRIEGVETLESLERLELQGNRVSNLDDVQSLAHLPCLRHVQLQVRGGQPDERNPMCDHPAYRSAMRRMLPNLQTLDGERTQLADASLPRDAASALNDLTFAEPAPWLKDFDWGEDDDLTAGGGGGAALAIGQLKSAQNFDAALVECKRMSAKAASLIEDYKAKTPR